MELMIVIVILGILMGAILPRLTGGQARTRDLARKSDLNSISQVMENFYGDHGRYPGTNENHVCLNSATIGSDSLSSYLKGGEMIMPPSDKQKIDNCTGYYWYKPISANGITRGGYIILTPVDQDPTANIKFDDIKNVTTLSDAETALNTYSGEGDVYVVTSQ